MSPRRKRTLWRKRMQRRADAERYDIPDACTRYGYYWRYMGRSHRGALIRPHGEGWLTQRVEEMHHL